MGPLSVADPPCRAAATPALALTLRSSLKHSRTGPADGPPTRCRRSNRGFQDLILRRSTARRRASAPGRNREWERREFFDLSITGFHSVTWLKHLTRMRKPGFPLHLRPAWPPPNGRGPTQCPVPQPAGGLRDDPHSPAPPAAAALGSALTLPLHSARTAKHDSSRSTRDDVPIEQSTRRNFMCCHDIR